MDTLPPPPIDAEVDLTDFAFMPLQVARLRKSKAWLICKRKPELAFYLLNLWTAAWHERPAGSLEDDDDVLADYAMCPPKEWDRIRAEVLRGWMKCSDGRLYHSVIVEVATNAWKSKLDQRYTRECDRLRKENRKRKDEQRAALPIPDFDDWNVARLSQRSGGIQTLSVGKTVESHGNVRGIPAESALKGREVKGREGKGHSLGAGGGIPPESIPPENGALHPTDAWRDITECDAQAYENWLAWRQSERDPVPSFARLEHAKFLATKGTPEQQRAFVAELIRRQFKRLHDPITPATGSGASNGSRKSTFDDNMAALDAHIAAQERPA